MGVITEADRKIESAKGHLKEAIQDLYDANNPDCWRNLMTNETNIYKIANALVMLSDGVIIEGFPLHKEEVDSLNIAIDLARSIIIKNKIPSPDPKMVEASLEAMKRGDFISGSELLKEIQNRINKDKDIKEN